MSFDWNKFRELAEELRQRDDEAARRTVISRLYYAIYWRSRLYLEDDGFVLREYEASHRQIWNEYKLKGGTFRAIFLAGTELHKNRIQADYVSEISNLEKTLQDSFKIAEKITFYLEQIEKNRIN